MPEIRTTLIFYYVYIIPPSYRLSLSCLSTSHAYSNLCGLCITRPPIYSDHGPKDVGAVRPHPSPPFFQRLFSPPLLSSSLHFFHERLTSQTVTILAASGDRAPCCRKRLSAAFPEDKLLPTFDCPTQETDEPQRIACRPHPFRTCSKFR